jgi:hypothetical protein
VDQDPNVVCGTLGISFGCWLCKWRKCSIIANRFMGELDTILEQLDNEEKKNIV